MPEMPQVTLALADYVIMIVYVLVLIGIGLYYRKFAQENLEHYFLAGRGMKGWMTGTSYAVTCMNTDVAPAYCGMTVITGLFICWWYISRFGLALMIGGVLFAVFWRRLKIFTSPEFYEMRFHGGPAITMRSWVSLRSAFIAVVAWTGSGLLGLHKVTEALLGWDKTTTFLVVIPVILFYVLLSGYMGVVVSDILQTCILIVSSIALMVLVLNDFGGDAGILAGPGELYRQLVANFGPQAVSWRPPLSHELLGVIGVIAWTVGTALGYGGDVAPMAGAMEGQRLLSCKNSREAGKMYFWTEGMLFLMLALLTLPALGAMVKWPGLHDGSINKELAFGMLLGHYMPAGLLGLALIAMSASIMSTVDSNLNFGAQVFINDVYRRSIHKNAETKHYMVVGRIVMFVIMGLAILVATSARNVIDISVFMLGLSSAELTANWGQWWWWRFNGKARLAASFGGPVVFLINKYLIFGQLVNLPQGTETYLVVLTSIGVTSVLWILVALLTEPDDEEALVEFYKLARPLGFWGPIAEKAGVESSGGRSIITGLGVSALGAVAIASGTVAFSCLYVARWGVAAAAAVLGAATGCLFLVTYRRFMATILAGEDDRIAAGEPQRERT